MKQTATKSDKGPSLRSLALSPPSRQATQQPKTAAPPRPLLPQQHHPLIDKIVVEVAATRLARLEEDLYTAFATSQQ
jgi:hypothetical protein